MIYFQQNYKCGDIKNTLLHIVKLCAILINVIKITEAKYMYTKSFSLSPFSSECSYKKQCSISEFHK